MELTRPNIFNIKTNRVTCEFVVLKGELFCISQSLFDPSARPEFRRIEPKMANVCDNSLRHWRMEKIRTEYRLLIGFMSRRIKRYPRFSMINDFESGCRCSPHTVVSIPSEISMQF